MATDLWAAFVAADGGTLATIKKDGRPQLSDISFTADADSRVVRISTRNPLAKTHNLRRDPRAGLHVPGPGGRGYAVAEADVELSAVAADPHDAVVEELVEVFRLVQRKEHPDWDDYRTAMVREERLILRLTVTHLYGWLP
jgi:PPOX class probable F420-dependent enzyme